MNASTPNTKNSPHHEHHQHRAGETGLCLNRLEVKNFAGITHAVLEPQACGVTVIHGPNEAGKSSLLQAFDLLISNIKPKTTSKAVTKFFPVSDDIRPEITADLTIGAYELRYQKSFQDKRVTLTITAPKVENLVSDEAIERFEEILSEHVDTDLRSALFVEQGKDVSKIDLTGIATLTESLHATEGSEESLITTQVSEGVAAELMTLVDKEDFKYRDRTKGRRAKGELKQAEEDAERASAAVSEAERVYAEAHKAIADLDRFQERRNHVRAEKPEAQRAVEHWQEVLKDTEQRQAKLDTAEQKLRNAIADRERHNERLNRRREKLDKLATLEQLVAEARTAMEAAKAEAASEAEQRDAATKQWLAAKNEAELSDNLHALLGGAGDLRARAEEINVFEKVRSEAEEIYEQIAATRREIEANPATDVHVSALRDAVTKLREEQRVREAVSTSVTVEGPEGTSVSHDNRLVELDEGAAQLKITQRTTLGLGDYRVTIAPAQDQSEQDEAVQRAAAACVRALRVFGSAGISIAQEPSATQAASSDASEEGQTTLEAEIAAGDHDDRLREALTAAASLSDTRTAQVADLRALEAQVTSMTGGRSQGQLESHAATLAQHHKEAESLVNAQAAAVVAASQGVLPLDSELDRSIELFIEELRSGKSSPGEEEGSETHAGAAAEGLVHIVASSSNLPAEESVRDWRAAATAAAQEAGDKREKVLASPATSAAAQATARFEGLEERRQELDSELTTERQQLTDEDAELAVRQADDAVVAATAAWEQEKANNADRDDLETVRLSLEGAQSHVAGLLDEEHQLDIAIATTTENLGAASHAAENLAQARDEYERVQRSLARVTRQADTAALLHRVLKKTRHEAKERYSAPYREELENLARLVFGTQVDVDVDENFQVTSRSAEGMHLDKNQLSGGAKEQLEILQLLATARLVGQGESVPIFLDDVLGFSDEHRAERMNLVLGKLGRSNQIIIFTCDRQRFARIPGAKAVAIDSVTKVE